MPQTIRFQSSYEEPYPLQVQGESHYQENVEDVTHYYGEDEGVKIDDLVAHLILEENNPSDENAVRVEIDGKAVGYLSRPSAKKYRARLAQLGLTDVIGECDASARGGCFKRSTGEEMQIGIRLDLNIETFDVEKPRAKIDRAPVATVVADPPAAPISSQAKNISPEANKKKMNPVLKVILIVIGIIVACFCGLVLFGTFLQMIGY